MNRAITTAMRPVRVMVVLAGVAAMAIPGAQATPTDLYGPLDPWAYNAIHREIPATPLDRWAYNAIHRSTASIPLVTENSAGQNRTAQRSAAPAKPGSASAEPNGFNWRDAGIGATSSLVLVMLVASAIAVRRRRAVAQVRF